MSIITEVIAGHGNIISSDVVLNNVLEINQHAIITAQHPDIFKQ